jgi:hypothetical protein
VWCFRFLRSFPTEVAVRVTVVLTALTNFMMSIREKTEVLVDGISQLVKGNFSGECSFVRVRLGSIKRERAIRASSTEEVTKNGGCD